MTDRVSGFLARAAAEPVELSIRGLLAIWGYRARTPDSTGRIGRDLSDAGLQCVPDLATGEQDATVRVGRPEATGQERPRAEDDSETDESTEADEDPPLQLSHIFPKIGDIPSASAGIIFVRPEDSLPHAQGLMVEWDYSQLAVMTGPYEIVGAVSWRTIATAKLAGPVYALNQVTDQEPTVVRASDRLFDRIGAIYQADFVFVRAGDGRVCGIVTTADLSAQFRDLTTPFFNLGEIEHRLRRCIKKRGFTVAELREATGDKRIKSVASMTFWSYYQLLKNEQIWRKMGFEVDQELFLGYLGSAHKIRNRIAHYDAKPVSPQDAEQVVKCLKYMRYLDPGPFE